MSLLSLDERRKRVGRKSATQNQEQEEGLLSSSSLFVFSLRLLSFPDVSFKNHSTRSSKVNNQKRSLLLLQRRRRFASISYERERKRKREREKLDISSPDSHHNLDAADHSVNYEPKKGQRPAKASETVRIRRYNYSPNPFFLPGGRSLSSYESIFSLSSYALSLL